MTRWISHYLGALGIALCFSSASATPVVSNQTSRAVESAAQSQDWTVANFARTAFHAQSGAALDEFDNLRREVSFGRAAPMVINGDAIVSEASRSTQNGLSMLAALVIIGSIVLRRFLR